MNHKTDFEEGDAKRILQRAAVLDAKITGRLSMEELRSVALEAGISERALAMALEESDTLPSETPLQRGLFDRWSSLRNRAKTAILTAATAVLGLITGALGYAPDYYFHHDGTGNAIYTLRKAAVFLVIVSVIGAARLVKRDRFNLHRLLNGVLWIGFFGGYALTRGHANSDISIIAGKGWALTTGISVLLVGIKMYLKGGPTSTPNEMKATAGA